MEKIRLSKRMSELGLCSRREADVYIEKGWVEVDGEIVSELGSKVYPHQKVALRPAARNSQQQRVTFLLNKPVGFVSGQAEHNYKPAVTLLDGAIEAVRSEVPRSALSLVIGRVMQELYVLMD